MGEVGRGSARLSSGIVHHLWLTEGIQQLLFVLVGSDS